MKDTKVVSVEHSKTEVELGGSDITVIIQCENRRHGLLIEDKIFDSIILKDGRVAAIVDFIGDYYIVDVGNSPEDWDTIEVREEEIVGNEATGILAQSI